MSSIKSLLVYTMTSGLGDYIVMGDLIRKIEVLIPDARCIIVHRNNPHIRLWEYDSSLGRFFNIYNPSEVLNLIIKLKKERASGFTVFGLQMAPGSMQGFLLHSLFKKINALDFIIDFNLINADIITPPKGNYILDLHLNQVRDLLKIDISADFYHLNIPIEGECITNNLKPDGKKRVGIHPWSRRGKMPCFTWPFESIRQVIKELWNSKGKYEIIIFGKDDRFEQLKEYIRNGCPEISNDIVFRQCSSVLELIGVVSELDILVSVNTSVVQIGYALNKKMVVLNGPSLDIWTPKGEMIENLYDNNAFFKGSDKFINNELFPTVSRISAKSVIKALDKILH